MLAAIVLTHESARHLETSLPALLDDLPEAARLIVWDNDSSDGSAVLARRLAPGATVVECPDNLGFAAGVNRAAELVPGADLLLINPDAVLAKGSVAALAAAIGADDRLAVAAGRVTEGGHAVAAAWRFPTAARATLGALTGLGRAYRPRFRDKLGASVVIDGFVPFTFALLRRRAFDDLGGLDTRFWLYGEDTDFCFRANRRGWRIGVVAAASAVHSGRGSSITPGRALRLQLEAEDRFRAQHSGLVGARIAAIAMTAGALARLAANLLRKSPSHRADEWRTVLKHHAQPKRR